MATKKSQRIGIWVIAIIMLAGTIGGFAAMIVSPGNSAKDQAAFAAEDKKYQEEYAKWSKEQQAVQQAYYDSLDAKAAELGINEKYFAEFSSYASNVKSFEAKEITELSHEDLKTGDGEVVKEDTKFAAYYIGWNPQGKIFDQSIDGEKLKTPIVIDGLNSASLIDGWKEGLVGMKIGSARLLSIPAELAYGAAGSGPEIPANTPLKFIVLAVPSLGIDQPKQSEPPEMSDYLKREYQKRYGTSY